MPRTVTARSTDRVDALLLGEFQGGRGFGALRFSVPRELGSRHHVKSDREPGVYLAAHSRNVSPSAAPAHEERLLTRNEALTYARLYDELQGYAAESEDPSISTFEQLVEAWYEALGRAMGDAVEKATERLMMLNSAKLRFKAERKDAKGDG